MGTMATAPRKTAHARTLRMAALVGVVAWIVAGAFGQMSRLAATWLGPTESCTWAELTVSAPGDVTVGRREQVLAAPVAGAARRSVNEGEAVARGAPLVRIESEDGPPAFVHASFAGVASFLADGQERFDWPKVAFSIPTGGARMEKARPRALFSDGDRVAAGQAVVRLVDRSEMYAVFSPRGRTLPSVSPGATVEIRDPSLGAVGIPASVVRAEPEPGTGRLLLRIERQPAEWLYRRSAAGVSLVVSRHQGVEVPVSALTTRGRRQGVWVRTDGGPVFVPVSVKIRLGRKAVVEGLPDGSRVYRWPRWMAGR